MLRIWPPMVWFVNYHKNIDEVKKTGHSQFQIQPSGRIIEKGVTTRYSSYGNYTSKVRLESCVSAYKGTIEVWLLLINLKKRFIEPQTAA